VHHSVWSCGGAVVHGKPLRLLLICSTVKYRCAHAVQCLDYCYYAVNTVQYIIVQCSTVQMWTGSAVQINSVVCAMVWYGSLWANLVSSKPACLSALITNGWCYPCDHPASIHCPTIENDWTYPVGLIKCCWN
jgi:hypothetical protein